MEDLTRSNETVVRPEAPPMFMATAHVTAHVSLKPGSRRMMELELRDGSRVQGMLSAHAKNLPEGLEGRFRVRLFLRTTKDGRLMERVSVAKVLTNAGHDLASPDEFVMVGKVVRLDRAEGLALVRVFPPSAQLEPFVVCCRASLAVMDAGEDAFSVRISGYIGRDLSLRADMLEPVKLTVPERFKDWVPPMKRRAPLPMASDSLEGGGG
jgi:hypothetical protein